MVDSRYDAHTYAFELTLSQSTPPTPGQASKEPFHIPFAVGLVAGDGRDMPLQLEGESTSASATKVRTYAGEAGVSIYPSASGRCRHCCAISAPVIVEHRYSDAELAFLSAHDSDAFNRWEAGQRLAIALMSLTDAGKPAGR